mgnify:FL=1
MRDLTPASGTSEVLAELLTAKVEEATERMQRGPPAFERFPDKALRYRDWGKETRHARGDAYPLYTLDTMRNLADHIFDWSSGYRTGSARAAQVKPCDVVYSTLRPTAAYAQKVHDHIRVPYLLITDTADDPIQPGRWTNLIADSKQLYRWWAVDNEMTHPKLDSIPIGPPDNLEPPGKKGQASSIVFHANITKYLNTLRRAQAQPKSSWLMMQMADTHPERRRVRQTFKDWRGEREVQLTPDTSKKMSARQFLQEMGRHRFVLSPRGNGLDAHRTWETMLVGAIPIVRHSPLHPLYDRLPVLVVADWPDVTPRLLRDFYANYSARRELYDYERLFADHWFERVGAYRARCLDEQHANNRPVGDGGATIAPMTGGGDGGGQEPSANSGVLSRILPPTWQRSPRTRFAPTRVSRQPSRPPTSRARRSTSPSGGARPAERAASPSMHTGMLGSLRGYLGRR